MKLDRRIKLKPICALITLALLAGCDSNNSGSDNDVLSAGGDRTPGANNGGDHKPDNEKEASSSEKRAYYGDYSSNRAFVIDVNKMSIDTVIENTGQGPYETDQVSEEFAYVLNRDDTNINVVSLHRDKIVNTIPLSYKPRSIVKSPNNKFGLLSGKSEPWASLIDLRSHEINIDGFKDSDYQKISDFGGGNATGHPFWVNDNQFLLLDRTENTIELYSKDGLTPSAKLSTSSSVHHVFKIENDYFAVLEGKRGSTPESSMSPGLIKFSIDPLAGTLNLIKEVLLSNYSDLPENFVSSTWGAHHATLHPDGKSIYLGSYEGNMFVINKDNFNLIDRFYAGLGLGHVAFVPERNIAITTNHYATFKTIVDTTDPANNKVIKNLEVAQADTAATGKRLQSHTSHTDPNEKYFYSVSSLDGVFYSINLDKLEIEKKVTLKNAYPLMGAFVIDEEGLPGNHEHINHL